MSAQAKQQHLSRNGRNPPSDDGEFSRQVLPAPGDSVVAPARMPESVPQSAERKTSRGTRYGYDGGLDP
jgi:hypothetical protein